MEGLVTVEQLAEELGISVKGVRKSISTGNLPPQFQLGRRKYHRRIDLNNWFAQLAADAGAFVKPIDESGLSSKRGRPGRPA